MDLSATNTVVERCFGNYGINVFLVYTKNGIGF